MHFMETLQPQKTKKTKKIAEEDDEGFVEENEAVIDPCDLLDCDSLKPCHVESLHQYGHELLDMFHEDGEVKTLDELLADRKRYEIVRYFQAFIMKANTRNVRLESDVRVD
ncbi:hypothetical protein Angca_000018, partial [Angiostrongylus cantonensis]